MVANTLLWTPTDIGSSNMVKFRAFVNSKHSLTLSNYDELYKWSTIKTADFWESVWHFCDMRSSTPYSLVIDESLSIDKIPKWFTGASINYTENMMRRDDEGIAIIGCGEEGLFERVTYAQLSHRVGQCALALAASGVTVGDRVVAYIPNCIEAVKTTDLGYIYASNCQSGRHMELCIT
jgi:acetoacetyl-CoA synthetase